MAGQKKGFKHTDPVAIEKMRWNGTVAKARQIGIHAPGASLKAGRATFEISAGYYAPEWKGVGLHVRWHVNRKKRSAECRFCYEESPSD
jgi:hypothetical protein